MKVQADVWLSNEDSDSDEYWAEGVKAVLEVELTDQDEVRLGVVLSGEESDTATLYLNRRQADKLGRFLAAASVDEMGVPA